MTGGLVVCASAVMGRGWNWDAHERRSGVDNGIEDRRLGKGMQEWLTMLDEPVSVRYGALVCMPPDTR